MRSIPWRQAVGIPLNVFLFLLLWVLAWGDVRDFFSHPARVVAVLLFVAMAPVMTLCTAGRSKGREHEKDDRRFFPLLVFHTLFTAVVMPMMDAKNVWTLPGGDVIRWVGVALLAAGVIWRLGPMVELGKRFTAYVALQEDHRLHTSGFYRRIRHPSYLGILLMDLGLAGLFRSSLALLLLPVVFWMFKRRMDIEESFLTRQFGQEYRDYMGRTARVIPGVY